MGRRREAGRWARTLGRRAWLVCGRRWDPTGRLMAEIADSLRAEGVEPVPVATLSHEPEVADVDQVTAELRGRDPAEGDFLLAIGGGAAIDLAKAAAAMATNREGPTVKDYLEGVGRGLTVLHPPLPVLAMPTTAGTGAEATRNAVISCYDPPFKKSLRDDRLMPRIALVDPELTVTAPPDVTAASGMDAITQLIESYVSKKCAADHRPDRHARAEMALPAIVEAVENGRSRRRAKPCRWRHCSRASRWPTRGSAWPTAWRPPWAPTAAWRTVPPAPDAARSGSRTSMPAAPSLPTWAVSPWGRLPTCPLSHKSQPNGPLATCPTIGGNRLRLTRSQRRRRRTRLAPCLTTGRNRLAKCSWNKSKNSAIAWARRGGSRRSASAENRSRRSCGPPAGRA